MDYMSLVAAKGTPGSIANWVNFSDALLPLADILGDAQTILWDQLRVYDMISTGTFTLLANSAAVAIPIGFNTPGGVLGVIGMWDNNQFEIKARLGRNVIARQVKDAGGVLQPGVPSFYSIIDNQFTFDQAPSVDMAYTYLYWKQPLLLGPGNLTNFLTNRYPHLLRRACLMMAADFLNDETKFQRYSQLIVAEIKGVSVSNDEALEGMQVDPDYSERNFSGEGTHNW